MASNKISNIRLSIRRVPTKGLPGDDPTLFNIKLGASLKGGSPLRGLTHREEEKYMPDIINYSVNDVQWRRATKNYWNNISVIIPADGTTSERLQGKILEFSFEFKSESIFNDFERLITFEEKAKMLSALDAEDKVKLIKGVTDYVLFQYCIKSSSVANRPSDMNKSPKISFYLYSEAIETKVKYNTLLLEQKAMAKFINVIEDEAVVDALLVMFEQDLKLFKDAPSKHLALDACIKADPKSFLIFAEDKNLKVKALLGKAVRLDIVNKPMHSDNYYYGDNNETILGSNLNEAVLFLLDGKNAQITNTIIARVNNK